jgi:hypothetical protein
MDYKARFYSPYLNRFIQPDSLIPDAQNPQAWNRYSYVKNNPVNFNDPTGHKWDDCSNVSGYRCKIHMKHAGPAIAEANRRAAAKKTAQISEELMNGVSGGKPVYSPEQIDGFCTEYANRGWGCGIWVSKEEAKAIMTQLRTDQLVTIGAFTVAGAVIGSLGGVWGAIGVGLVSLVIGTVITWDYEDAYEEIQTASDSTPDGERIFIKIGQANSISPTLLHASGYDPVEIHDGALESIIRVTGIDVPYNFSPNSTPFP